MDQDNPAPFYMGLGYEKWYGSPSMSYKGEIQPNVELEFIPYEDKFYEQYVECRAGGFYEIAVKNDFQPYVIPQSEKDKKMLAAHMAPLIRYTEIVMKNSVGQYL